MKRIVVVTSLILFGACIHWGLLGRTDVKRILEEKAIKETQIIALREELVRKKTLAQLPPVQFRESFKRFIDQISVVGVYGDVKITLLTAENSIQAPLESLCHKTDFRGVRGLSVLMRVARASTEVDMGLVLDAVRLVSSDIDLKLMSIEQENNGLLVKGELYGL